ncbi:Hypothetical predicted protein [Lecanosticta acicola]|uniref:Uncharacterized protein n=1 Tax=Lecanosticta acicola TaxID=111012 RepID=A0AAI8W1T7_9PEZI|nr:Hypothetical predicted protein [Lecanosticta acicola]
MTKRRRERDKPKAGPESLYNPNKRILLSYGDDDEEEIQDAVEAATGAPAAAAHLANYQMDTYSPEPVESDARTGAEVVETTRQATEREHWNETPTSEAREVGEAATRQVRNEQSSNLELGPDQREDDEEEFDLATGDALVYIKAVRSENQGIPEILTAPRPPLVETSTTVEAEDSPHHDEHKAVDFHDDEAFIGTPERLNVTEDETDPCVIYTRTLKARFLEQRKQMHRATSARALAALGDVYPISFPKDNKAAIADWNRILTSQTPRPAQVRSLDQDTVFELLALTQRYFMTKLKNIKNKTSVWIWSLLARLDDVGTMTNDQVFLLRELGKKALLLQFAIWDPETAAQLEAVDQAERARDVAGDVRPSSSTSGTSHMFGDDRRSSTPQSTSHITDNTKATLDMILAVIGEVFGQRDLLEYRQSWTSTNRPA